MKLQEKYVATLDVNEVRLDTSAKSKHLCTYDSYHLRSYTTPNTHIVLKGMALKRYI